MNRIESTITTGIRRKTRTVKGHGLHRNTRLYSTIQLCSRQTGASESHQSKLLMFHSFIRASLVFILYLLYAMLLLLFRQSAYVSFFSIYIYICFIFGFYFSFCRVLLFVSLQLLLLCCWFLFQFRFQFSFDRCTIP